MQAETVYEFGSSPDEDDNNQGQSHNKSLKKKPLQQANQQTSIAGTNLRPNKTSSTSINQKLNTSFPSVGDNNPSSQSPNLRKNPSASHPYGISSGKKDISNSDDQLLLDEPKLSATDGSTNTVGASSISNTSNTSLSSATNSSRGNISQSGNISAGTSSSLKISSHQPSSSQQHNQNFDSNVISERVKNLATQIYQELKRIISRCNYDEDILSGLMPLIVRVLESLDLALIENQQLQVELELCKDDNEQLVIMFEKEKAAKRAIDKKLIESEYAYEEERQQYQQKIESLDNTVKMFELKAKNASDQATRYEEKEAERKKEYNKLHDRYTDLLKSHCDVVERVRHLFGNAEVANLNTINVPRQMVASSSDLATISELQSQHLSKAKLKNDDPEFDRAVSTRSRDPLKSWNDELTLEDASLVVIEDILEPHKAGDGSSQNESSERATETEGDHEKESENDSIAYTSMEKEFRKLIQENKDLLNTKNALNVVKDDLIAEVDRLTNEVSMYEQAVEQLNLTKDQMKHRISTLDNELRKTKEELEKAKQKIRENNEEGVPYSQRKRFGRAEMAKVLMERNNYKERFMELQEAVRYTEQVRANKVETEKRSGLWKFFNNLFGVPPRETLAITAGPTSRNSSPVISYHGSPAATITSPDQQASFTSNQLVGSDVLQSAVVHGNSIRSTNQRLSGNSNLIVLMDSDLNIDRSRAFSAGGGRINSDISGYIHAYGWSLPASSVKAFEPGGGNAQSVSSILAASPSDPLAPADCNASLGSLSSLQVPIPQYCRPLTGDSLGMKIWCATAIDLSGGDLKNDLLSQRAIAVQGDTSAKDLDISGSIVNISSSTPMKTPDPGQHSLEALEEAVEHALSDGHDERNSIRPVLKTTTEMVKSALPLPNDSQELSSCVWICSTQHSRSKITIIDIKTKPNEMLDSFYVPTFLYCVKTIPGSKPGEISGIVGFKDSTLAGSSPQICPTLTLINDLISTQKREFYKLVAVDLEAENRMRMARLETRNSTSKNKDVNKTTGSSSFETSLERSKSRINEDDAEISRILDNNVSVGIATLEKLNDFVAHIQPQPETSTQNQSTLNEQSETICSQGATHTVDYYQPISTYLPTVWMGGKDSVLYIHSAIGQWKDCVACVKLRDSILQICHFRGRVFVALADGSLCVFFRDITTKQWEFSMYLIIDINAMAEVTNDIVDLSESQSNEKAEDASAKNLSQQLAEMSIEKPDTGSSNATHPVKSKTRSKVAGIRCLEIANKNIWVGYKNKVLIIDPITLKLRHTFNVVPQVDNQIRQLISMKDGVFCCLRSDLILRLYSSLRPYQHIQNIDIEPIVTRLISPKTFVISHITAMKVVDNIIWIGNAHGIILTIPCKLVPQVAEAPTEGLPGQFEESSSSLSIARFVPKCDITNAQISFHGHKDAVKFFIQAHDLMLSGGQGYLDFRIDMDDQSKSISDKSHLILWQLRGKGTRTELSGQRVDDRK